MWLPIESILQYINSFKNICCNNWPIHRNQSMAFKAVWKRFIDEQVSTELLKLSEVICLRWINTCYEQHLSMMKWIEKQKSKQLKLFNCRLSWECDNKLNNNKTNYLKLKYPYQYNSVWQKQRHGAICVKINSMMIKQIIQNLSIHTNIIQYYQSKAVSNINTVY